MINKNHIQARMARLIKAQGGEAVTVLYEGETIKAHLGTIEADSVLMLAGDESEYKGSLYFPEETPALETGKTLTMAGETYRILGQELAALESIRRVDIGQRWANHGG